MIHQVKIPHESLDYLQNANQRADSLIAKHSEAVKQAGGSLWSSYSYSLGPAYVVIELPEDVDVSQFTDGFEVNSVK